MAAQWTRLGHLLAKVSDADWSPSPSASKNPDSTRGKPVSPQHSPATAGRTTEAWLGYGRPYIRGTHICGFN